MTSRLTTFLASTDALDAVFADESWLQALLDVEAALARAEARLGVIPEQAASVISQAADASGFDIAALARGGRTSGTIVVPLVSALTSRVREADALAARFVHWGATSQDIADTALVLLVNRAAAVLAEDHGLLAASLRTLSDRHAAAPMIGRTLLQPAPPITFGLKVAGWYAALARSWRRLERERSAAAILQFGGASGTLAALGDSGLAVADELARELALPPPEAPWHAQRDRLVGLIAACGVYVGALGKIARDISLLMQAEVGEVAEAGGTSSTLPSKRNPVGCATVLAAATRMPGLVATALTGLPHEHERSVGAWHAEWPVVADVLGTTATALVALRDTVACLTVNPARMRENLDTAGGAAVAERVMMLAGAALGRDRAHTLVAAVLAECRRSGQPFGAAIRAHHELAAALADFDLDTVDTPEAYLGSAESLRQRLLATSERD